MSILEHGSTGAAVKELQSLLNTAGAWPLLNIDGGFGDATERAVHAFQEKAGLVVDGKVGEQTRIALRQSSAPIKQGRAEPDKSAIAGAVAEQTEPVAHVEAAPPPNGESLTLLDTARPIREIIVHCTATPEGKDYTVDDVRAWHKQRGWSDIGYHYVIYRDGRVMLGRPVGQVGAHVEGHNTGTIGISYIGGLTADAKTAKDTRTAAQRASLLWLVGALAAKHRNISKVSGHNEYAAKACPSFDVRRDPLGKIAA